MKNFSEVKNRISGVFWYNMLLNGGDIEIEEIENKKLRITGFTLYSMQVAYLLVAASCIESVDFQCCETNQAFQLSKTQINKGNNKYKIVERKIDKKRFSPIKGYNISFTTTLDSYSFLDLLHHQSIRDSLYTPNYKRFVDFILLHLAFTLFDLTPKEQKIYVAETGSNLTLKQVFNHKIFWGSIDTCDSCNQLISSYEENNIEECPNQVSGVFCDDCYSRHLEKCNCCKVAYQVSTTP
ncbi:hypothetical protein [Paenibacillus soyae]|uniref:Uncharacterized protein n=1 Tax=Paenibacillus soyae TaxID=2969249 RepID=A0A9X2S9Q6_9BACL|nr:hypothetical protein [Paenibacillus soyae]MCR2805401.1 hypothetical protein [Paenibacillus soyae]